MRAHNVGLRRERIATATLSRLRPTLRAPLTSRTHPSFVARTTTVDDARVDSQHRVALLLDREQLRHALAPVRFLHPSSLALLLEQHLRR